MVQFMQGKKDKCVFLSLHLLILMNQFPVIPQSCPIHFLRDHLRTYGFKHNYLLKYIAFIITETQIITSISNHHIIPGIYHFSNEPQVLLVRNYVLKPYLVLGMLSLCVQAFSVNTARKGMCLQIHIYIYAYICIYFPPFLHSCTLSTVFLSPHTVFVPQVKYTICNVHRQSLYQCRASHLGCPKLILRKGSQEQYSLSPCMLLSLSVPFILENEFCWILNP